MKLGVKYKIADNEYIYIDSMTLDKAIASIHDSNKAMLIKDNDFKERDNCKDKRYEFIYSKFESIWLKIDMIKHELFDISYDNRGKIIISINVMRAIWGGYVGIQDLVYLIIDDKEFDAYDLQRTWNLFETETSDWIEFHGLKARLVRSTNQLAFEYNSGGFE